MSKLQNTLNRLESQLRILIEGSAEKLFPSNDMRDDLAHTLVSALRREIKVDPDGVKSAPNLYTLLLPSQQARALQENQALLDEVARSLEKYARQADLHMNGKPILKVVPAPPGSDTDMNILASFSQAHLGETLQVEVRPTGESVTIPRGAFLIVNGAQIVPLNQPVINIGRGDDNDLIIGDLHVSREHAQLRAIRGTYTIFDLNSSGGTFVNGTQTMHHVLIPGDLISLAGVPLIYGQEQPYPGEETQDLSDLGYSQEDSVNQ